jgi:Putative Actinobacterial Holin-X, holin superfamily III
MAANGTVHLRDRGVGTLVRDLSDQASMLVRQEIELAKAEMIEKGKKAGVGAGILGGAAVAALMMLGSLTALLILAFALIVPAWAAALIITALWTAAAGVLAIKGRNALRELGKPVPGKTVETIKEDLQWLKNRN